MRYRPRFLISGVVILSGLAIGGGFCWLRLSSCVATRAARYSPADVDGTGAARTEEPPGQAAWQAIDQLHGVPVPKERVRGDAAPRDVTPRPVQMNPASPGRVDPYSEEAAKASIESRFLVESFDPSWSKESARQLRNQVLDILQSHSDLVSVDCHISMCKIETRHPDLDAYRAFVKDGLFSPKFKWDGPGMATLERTEPDGAVVAVAYLGRGHGPLYDPEGQ